MEVQIEKRYQCRVCDANFLLKAALYKHYNDNHNFASMTISDNPYPCGNCYKSFLTMGSLKRHIKYQHWDQSLKATPFPAPNVFTCYTCKGTFSRKDSLKLHLRKNHIPLHLKDVTCANKALFSCCNCTFSCRKFDELLNHYSADHEIDVKTEEFTFDNVHSFLLWKYNEETQCCNRFIKHRKTRFTTSGCENIVYYCHRRGCYKSRSEGKRHVKIQGSKKSGLECPARMFVKVMQDGNVLVRYVNCHMGHDSEMCHLGLSRIDRKSLADKIALKIPFENILDDARSSVSGVNTRLDRLDLITRKDLNNIERSFKLTAQRGIRHENDAMSVDAWATESEAVLFYKAQGTFNESIPKLDCDDFCLVIMDDSQKLVMERFGKYCVCLDIIHGVCTYEFDLTTLLVLDELQQGFPCAFMISNKTNEKLLSLFFRCVRNQVTIRNTKVFMSDLDNGAYKAWETEMGPADYRLYCDWHVDAEWRNRLKKLACSFNKKKDVYKKLKACMQETDQKRFSTLLVNILSGLNSDGELLDFANYFKLNYLESVKSWAYCYRLHSGLNTSMQLERMHRTVKYIYLKAKRHRRVDACIYSLLNFTRDKVLDRLLSLNKESISSKILTSQKRHVESLKISPDDIVETDNTWSIKSSDGNKVHTIFVGNEKCKCCFECSECNICVHKYLCTCIDSSIKWNICKHVHALARYNNVCKSEELPDDLEIVINGNIVDDKDCVGTTSSNVSPQSLQEAKQTLLDDFEYLINNNVNTLEDLLLVRKLLQPILPSLKAAKLKKATRHRLRKNTAVVKT